jgi:hypothetical protein
VLSKVLENWIPCHVGSSKLTSNSVIVLGGLNCNLEMGLGLGPNTKAGVGITAPSAALGLGSGTVPPGLRRFSVSCLRLSLSNSVRSLT